MYIKYDIEMWSIEVSTIGFKLDPSWLFDNIIILIKWNLIQYLLHEITTTPAARIRSLNFQFSSRLSVNINFNFNCLTMMKNICFDNFVMHHGWFCSTKTSILTMHLTFFLAPQFGESRNWLMTELLETFWTGFRLYGKHPIHAIS